MPVARERILQAVTGLDRWLETTRVTWPTPGYGGPVVHWWNHCLAYTGAGLDWRYEGIVGGYLTLWRATGVRGYLDKAVRAGEIFRDCARRSGLAQKYGRGLRLHSLRHAFATQLYQNGMPLGSLKRLLGHDRLATTVVYLDCPWERCLAQLQAALP